MDSRTDPTYVSWLQDASVMEQTLIKVLEERVASTGDFPEVQRLDQRHLEETRAHAAGLEACLDRLGSGPSTAKSMVSSLMSTVEKPAKALMKDEVVKNCLQDYGAECFEVACYTSLIAAGTALGDEETVAVCRQNMTQDLAMAEAILTGIPTVTLAELQKVTA